jgi:riboflavin kinase/FMN adenylyltransferase
MKRYVFSLGEVPPLSSKLTLCLGNFDGVHRGHQLLVLEARKRSEGDVGVLLFDQSPSVFFPSKKSSSVLTSLEDKCVRFASLGVDVIYIIHVSQDFFALSPAEFIQKVLAPLKPAALVVGTDYTYGAEAAGNLASLEKAFPVFSVPLLEEEGHKISTQSIIKEIGRGDLGEANAELGYPYQVKGTIAHGLANGRKIGFPTANLALEVPYVLPKAGVYLGVGYLRGKAFKSLINVGNNPTVGVLKHPLIEAYLDGFAGEAYGETLYLEFDRFLREEKKFASLDELRQAIENDKKVLHR